MIVSRSVQTIKAAGEAANAFRRRSGEEYSGQYLVQTPRNFDAKVDGKWPLILFLHGLGERGSHLEMVKKHGPPKIAADRRDFPFIVVSPQCPEGQWWRTEWLAVLLDEVCEKLPVDISRIYLTGLSMGGFGTWNLAMAYPERFAAIAPICGGGDPYPPYGYDEKRAQALRDLPIWTFHGAKDPVVKIEETERMVCILRHFGCTIEFTVYPEAEHNCWTQTYENPKLYEWFLNHRKPEAFRR
jgi:predicted peptidase